MSEFPRLFSPIKIRGLELKNRIIMTGMGSKMNDQSYVTDQLIEYHAARARGGVAMNTLEVCSVDDPSAPKNFVSISDDKYIPGHKKLVDAIHANGGTANIQLWQGAMAVGSDPDAEILFINEIDNDTIYRVIKAYGDAARRATEAGYDAVEFHGAHNYLPHSFLSGGMNYREDEWGGSLENRMKFPLECIKAIRANITEEMPLFMRVDCFDDGLPGGLTIEEVIEFCKKAGEAGVDVLNISRGNFMNMEALIYETPPMDVPHYYNVDATERIRKETGMLCMPTGRFNFPYMAEKVLEEDKADLVVMARAQLADPEFCNKVQAGKLSNIKYCIGCDQGCYDYFTDPQKPHISCLRNPAVGQETKYQITKTDTPKKVLIAGGGIAGLEAADILHDRGHMPVIYEASDHLGGMFLLAGKAPRKEDTYEAMKLFARNAEDLGVEIHLNEKVTPELILETKPDAVMIATGADPVVPSIPGREAAHVHAFKEILDESVKVTGNTIVIGGGLVGLEVAEFLAARDNKITVLEMLEEAGNGIGEMRRIAINQHIQEAEIEIMTSTACKEIKENSVVAEGPEGVKEIPCDNVIVAVGSRPGNVDDLMFVCQKEGIPYYLIGDVKPGGGKAITAVQDAFYAAFEI